ncbi:MAG: cysteine desulfurase [Haliscomenobacter sp.]|uniref:aminotransferase class V-fold PLP-dependent enzyme n=1 Tax=Haliscomenobacter sp. TaxID=2717303 RepID=UPI0029A770B3|nr:cysteine desulfurase [Haliscomenobacter sp.]MDX2071745.1 cysteine desulfurase [Haliscomenobacter sp.]
MFSPQQIRQNFPVFQHFPNLVYLDSASTTQKPQVVIAAEQEFYEQHNANVHRGIYRLAAKATSLYEGSRDRCARFLNAPQAKQIIFTSGTTDGINLVAQCFALPRLEPGDQVLISSMEHHSNLIPWQQVCLAKKAELKVIPFDQKGELDLQVLRDLLSPKVKILALTHISNTLGTINPIAEIIALAHAQDIPVLVDAAQSISSHQIDVQTLDVDFLVFSGHKTFGPTGTGVLYGKEKWLKEMPPYRFGGEMIRDVTFEKTTFAPIPHKFEAGTPNIAGVATLATALDFVESLGQNHIAAHLQTLLVAGMEKLRGIPGIQFYGEAAQKSGIISFTIDGIHPHDLATILGQQDICIRAGHHCTQPIMDFYEIPGTVRASFSVYNSVEDLDKLKQGLAQVIGVLQ